MEYVEKFEGERAKEYENRIGKMIPFYDGILEIVTTFLIEYTPPNGKILSVGCGTGADFRNLLEKFPDRFQITGIDPSSEMIEQAKKNFPSVQFYCGTIGQFPLDPKFHSATLLFVLHFLPDDGAKLSLLKDIYSRLEKGGSFILFDLYIPDMDTKVLKEILESYLKNFQNWEGPALKLYLKRVFQLFRIQEQRYTELLKEAGFSEAKQSFRCLHVGGWTAVK